MLSKTNTGKEDENFVRCHYTQLPRATPIYRVHDGAMQRSVCYGKTTNLFCASLLDLTAAAVHVACSPKPWLCKLL